MSETRRSPDRAALREGIALSRVERVGCVGFRARVERYGSAAEAFAATVPRAARAAALGEADEILARVAAIGAGVCVFGEPDYPARLTDLGDPPSVLFTLGDLSMVEHRAVAIVGMRHSSPGGDRIARLLAREVSARGAAVISGMARGIDAAAHSGALEARGSTIAVLGGGVDLPYPPRHRDLHRRIAAEGLVLSEADPGSPPSPGAFPRRNRLIAALSHIVVVVEAGVPSGALITAEVALELGRQIAALPGAIDAPRSTGTNRLIRDGAAIITCANDLLELAGLPRDARGTGEATGTPATCASGKDGRTRDELDRAAPAPRAAGSFSAPRAPGGPNAAPRTYTRDDPAADAVLDAIRVGASSLDEIVSLTRLPARNISAAIVSLELHGLVTSALDGSVSLGP